MRKIDEEISELVENCGDGVDLDPYKEQLKKEMAEKKQRRNKLKLQRTATADAQSKSKDHYSFFSISVIQITLDMI